ncbi:MAG: hypothetical protein K6G50_02105 [bacterium]|nr:hypothetical protein [bacterium]
MKRVTIAAVLFVLLFSVAAIAQEGSSGLLTLNQQPNMFYEPEVKYPPAGASHVFLTSLPWALLLAILLSGAVAWITSPLSEVEILLDARQMQKKSLESEDSETSDLNSDDEGKDEATDDASAQQEAVPVADAGLEQAADEQRDSIAAPEIEESEAEAREQSYVENPQNNAAPQEAASPLQETASEIVDAGMAAADERQDIIAPLEMVKSEEVSEEIIDIPEVLPDSIEQKELISVAAIPPLPEEKADDSEQNSFLKELSSSSQEIKLADINGFDPKGTICRRFEESLCPAKIVERKAIQNSGAVFSSMSITEAIHETVLPLVNKKSYCGLYIYSGLQDLRMLISAIAVEALRLYKGTIALVSSCAIPEDVADMLLGTDLAESLDERIELLRASIVKNEKQLRRIYIPGGILSFENFVKSIKEIDGKSGLACAILDMSAAFEMGITDKLLWLKMLDEAARRYGYMFFVAANAKELSEPVLSSCVIEAEIASEQDAVEESVE